MDSVSSLTSIRVQQDVNMEKPMVSVIIIFFNAENFLHEAIESVFSQTYEAWELLLVDDGSTDGSTDIALRYSNQFPEKIRYQEHTGHKNLGKPASRNLGIRKSSGEYIAFLDADDVWLPNKLEQQVAMLKAHPEAAMVFGRTQYWYSWTGKPEDCQRDYVQPIGVTPDTPLKPLQLISSFFLQQQTAIPCPSDIMIRRKVIEEIGGFEERFNGLYNVYEDQAFLAKVCIKKQVIAKDTCWERYRQHPNSSCAVAERAGQEMEARQFFLDWLASFLLEQGVKDRRIWRGLRKELWRNKHPNFQRLARRMETRFKHAKLLSYRFANRLLPAPVYHWLRALIRRQEYIPPVGWVRLGNLRRLSPLSRDFGYDRGVPVDRYYIENFLSNYQQDIKGQVLEIADDSYTRLFGGSRVIRSDVLHAPPGSSKATIVGDLSSAGHLPPNTYDCVILTQTLQVIYDLPAAIRTVYSILKPGGVVLVTVPGISSVSRYDMERWGYYWSFTTQSAKRLFEEVFPPSRVQVNALGNVLAASAFLFGMAQQELRREELDYHDPDYELVITIRAVK